MTTKLDKALVKRWLKDQQAAAQKIEEERICFLFGLDAEQALALYLSLQYPPHEAQLSPLLLAMRRMLARSSP